MGAAEGWGCRFALALVQSSLYLWLLWRHNRGVRNWCKVDYKTTDCQSKHNRLFESNTTSGLKVVMPSWGQTGTTSLIMALRELGYRAYHADDFSVMAKPVMFDRVHPQIFAKTASRCRMEAISLEPVTDLLPVVALTSPEAKFVLTWRSYPSWKKSTTAFQVRDKTLGPVSAALTQGDALIPWVEMWDWLFGTIKRVRMEGDPFAGRFTVAAYLYRQLCNSYAWPVHNVKQRGTYKGQASEEAYLGHINEIRTTVHPGRLLELDVSQHGWAELERFLGLRSERTGKPFPRPRSSQMRTNEPLLEKHFDVAGWALLLLVLCHCLNYTLLVLALHTVCAASLRWWHRGRRRWEAALARSPVIAVLDGLEPAGALQASDAVLKAGVRIILVALSSPSALESIRLLVQKLPPEALVGVLLPRAQPRDVRAVRAAGGSLLAAQCADPGTSWWAKALGLANLVGACTPCEALGAWEAGADAVMAAPELVPPALLSAWRAVLPEHADVVLTGATEPAAGCTGALRAARISALGVTICSPADAATDSLDGARQWLATYSPAKLSIEASVVAH